MSVLLAQRWWVLALRGVIAIAFGLVAFFLPYVALTALAFLFAGYALLDGILSLAAAFMGIPRRERLWRLILEGIAGILIAVLTVSWPVITVLALVYLVAARAFLTGIFALWTAFELRRHITGEWVLGLAGAASVLFGVLLAIAPAIGGIVVAWWVGAYALVFGVLMFALALRLRKWGHAPGPQLSPV